MNYPIKFLGYHAAESLPVKAGQMVVVPRGTPFTSTNPSRRQGVTKRGFVVRVNHVLPGMEISRREFGTPAHGVQPETLKIVQRPRGEEEIVAVKNPSVRWVGSGGYWVEVDINFVRKADDTAAPT